MMSPSDDSIDEDGVMLSKALLLLPRTVSDQWSCCNLTYRLTYRLPAGFTHHYLLLPHNGKMQNAKYKSSKYLDITLE